MSTILSLTIAAAMLLPAANGAAAPGGAEPFVILNPEWERKPTQRELSKAFPYEIVSSFRKSDAAVRLRCRVQADGGVEDCVVASMTTTAARTLRVERNLAESALKLAPTFQMKPVMADGRSVGGALVIVPIIYKARQG